MATALLEIAYTCLFCEETIHHMEGEMPIYKITREQLGKREACICPRCIEKIGDLIRKENKVN